MTRLFDFDLDVDLERRRFLKVAALGAAGVATSCSNDDGDEGGDVASSTTPQSQPGNSGPGNSDPGISDPGTSHPGTSNPAGSESGGAIPRPTAVARTSWAKDEWTGGSYSFLAVGATPQSREALVSSIGDRVFFAGEATSVSAPATVHGALRSGVDAAAEVLGLADAGERVIVVGAGISGIAAARKLADAGFSPVVYEAASRIGGRLFTLDSGESVVGNAPDRTRSSGKFSLPIELGASWVHDVAASEVADRLEDLDVETAEFDYEQRLLSTQSGSPTDLDTAQESAGEVLDAALDWAGDQEEDRSLADAIEAVRDRFSDVSENIMSWFEKTEVASEYGADASELSAYWGLEEGSEGDDILVLGGYDRLLRELTDGIDVQPSRPVTAIHVDGDKVRVGSQLDGKETEDSVDRVIVTVPLGAFKAELIEFDPPLSEEKRAAIDAIGMGVLNKFWFEFDEKFWSEDAQMWTWLDPGDNPFDEWFNLEPATGEPVLLALVGGSAARELETKSDDEVLALARASLQAFIDGGW